MGAGRDREDEALHLVLGNVEARQDLELRASESGIRVRIRVRNPSQEAESGIRVRNPSQESESGIRVRNLSQESESGNRQHLELREGCMGVRARD